MFWKKYKGYEVKTSDIACSPHHASVSFKDEEYTYKVFLLTKSFEKFRRTTNKDYLNSRSGLFVVLSYENGKLFDVEHKFFLPRKEKQIVLSAQWHTEEWVWFINRKKNRELLLEQFENIKKSLKKSEVKLNKDLKALAEQKLLNIEEEIEELDTTVEKFYEQANSANLEKLLFKNV